MCNTSLTFEFLISGSSTLPAQQNPCILTAMHNACTISSDSIRQCFPDKQLCYASGIVGAASTSEHSAAEFFISSLRLAVLLGNGKLWDQGVDKAHSACLCQSLRDYLGMLWSRVCDDAGNKMLLMCVPLTLGIAVLKCIEETTKDGLHIRSRLAQAWPSFHARRQDPASQVVNARLANDKASSSRRWIEFLYRGSVPLVCSREVPACS